MEIKVGHCKQCGSCCEYVYTTASQRKNDKVDEEVKFKTCQGSIFKQFEERHWGYLYYVATPIKKCKSLKKKDGKCFCKLHGTDKQSTVCRDWPYTGDQGYFQAVNTVFGCGYFFIDIEVECPQPIG